MSETICAEDIDVVTTEQKPRELGVNVASSPVLARLIEEVRNDNPDGPYAYNRQHNRHNR